MRIAFLSTFYPFRGGIAQFNANLLEALSADNETKAFTFTCQYPSLLFPGKTQYVTPNDRAKAVGSEALLSSVNPVTWISCARRIAAWKPDVVIMKYWTGYLAPSLGSVARMLRHRGIRVIAILDNVIPHEKKFFDRPLSRWFLRSCSGCIAMSRAVLDDMLALTPDKPWKLLNHPLYDHFGAKTDRGLACSELGLDPSKRNLLFFGLIRDYKGLDLLLEAMKHLDERYNLVIAGESYGDFSRYSDAIAALGTRCKVFCRYIGDEQVPSFFSASDLCILPYKSATQSGITSVAMHFDLPIVATPVGGLPEIVGQHGIGIVTDGICPSAIAGAVEKYFEGGGDLYIKAIRDFKAQATWSVFAKAIIEFYKTL